MNRREVIFGLAAIPCTLAGCPGDPTAPSCSTSTAGATPTPTDTSTPTPDPFPDDIPDGERGGADSPISVQVEETGELRSESSECANRAHSALRAFLEDKIDDYDRITGITIGGGGYDGWIAFVMLITATYGRDGDLMSTPEIDYDTLRDVTPPTVYLEAPSGEQLCAVPVYVGTTESYVD